MSHTTATINPITAAFDTATAAAHIPTPAPTAARTPAKSTDRRRSYPLAEADRKLLAAVPFIEDTGDLDTIPADRRRRALIFLAKLAEDGTKTRDALDAAKLITWELSWVRTHSETFRKAHEVILDARIQVSKQRIVETLVDLANGEFVQKPGCLPPEVRAASLLLPAVDERFRGNPATAQQVQINIAI